MTTTEGDVPRAVRTQGQLDALQELRNQYSAVSSQLISLPDEGSQVMVPVTPVAFMAGNVINPEEVMVYLGDGHFVQRTPTQARGILARREEEVAKSISQLEGDALILPLTRKDESFTADIPAPEAVQPGGALSWKADFLKSVKGATSQQAGGMAASRLQPQGGASTQRRSRPEHRATGSTGGDHWSSTDPSPQTESARALPRDKPGATDAVHPASDLGLGAGEPDIDIQDIGQQQGVADGLPGRESFIIDIREWVDDDGVQTGVELHDLGRVLKASPGAAAKLYGNAGVGSAADSDVESGPNQVQPALGSTSSSAGVQSGAPREGHPRVADPDTGVAHKPVQTSRTPDLEHVFDELERQELEAGQEDDQVKKRGLLGSQWKRGFLSQGSRPKKGPSAAGRAAQEQAGQEDLAYPSTRAQAPVGAGSAPGRAQVSQVAPGDLDGVGGPRAGASAFSGAIVENSPSSASASRTAQVTQAPLPQKQRVSRFKAQRDKHKGPA